MIQMGVGDLTSRALNNRFFNYAQIKVHIFAQTTEGEPEFVNEVVAGLLFLIGRGQVEFLVGPEIGNQFFDPTECLVEARWHGRASVRRKAASVNSGARPAEAP